jgi:hypothetical protein
MREMKVSVLVPVFNAERYLGECLESILAQDFPSFEIIISDDASTDNSGRIIERYAARDSRIRWWKNPRNLGEADNSNLCLKAAKGEYIKLVHADDLLLSPCAISKMVAAMEAYPEASLVGCFQHFTPTDVRFCFEPQVLSQRMQCFNGREMIVQCLEKDANLIGNPSQTLFKRSQAQRGFDDRFRLKVDYEMWFHLLEQGDFVHLPEALATWRLHSTQQTTLARGTEPPSGLLLVQTYYEKAWLQEAASPRMLFVQSRSLRKRYGSQAAALVRKMQSSLSPAHFLALSLERKRLKFIRWTHKMAGRFKLRELGLTTMRNIRKG